MNVKKKALNTGAAVKRPDYRREITDIVRTGLAPIPMRDKIASYHESDVASAMEIMSAEQREYIYRVLGADMLADIFEYAGDLNRYLDELSVKKKAEVLSRLEITSTVGYLRHLEKDERMMLIDLLDSETKNKVILLNSFDEDEIGSRMSANYICIKSGSDVRQAMRELIRQAADNDNISVIYVVDDTRTLVGAIDLKDLIIARESTELDAIIMSAYPYVYADEQIADCIERIKEYSEDSIPVLDSDNRLQGVLTSQDVTQIMEEEIGEDYVRLAGLSSEEDLEEPLRKSMGKRLPWLVILLGLGLVVSSVVGAFETVVAQLTLIISFQSLVLDMAGNVGTQSLAVTIRVLMNEKIGRREKLRLVAKEARVGLANGVVLGILSFLFIGLYLIVLKGQTSLFAFSVSFCTGAALLASIVLSSVTGTVVPIIFKKMKIDPAVASGPLITTVNDLVAVVAYYGLAWILLINVLGL